MLLCLVLVTEREEEDTVRHLTWSLHSVPLLLGSRQEVGLEKTIFHHFHQSLTNAENLLSWHTFFFFNKTTVGAIWCLC